MSPRETSLISAEATWLSETWAKPSSRAIFADKALVRRIAIGVHEHDRDGVVALGARVGERGANAIRIGRGLDRAVGAHALVDLDHAGIELLGLYDVACAKMRGRA